MNSTNVCFLAKGRPVGLGAAAAVLLVIVLSGCVSTGPAPVYEPAPPGYYRIHSGDTLSQIAGRHGLAYETLAKWNELGPPYRIYAGSLLRVEPPHKRVEKATGTPPKTTRTTPEKATPTPTKAAQTPKQARTREIASSKTATGSTRGNQSGGTPSAMGSGLKWRWPMQGEVVQRFRSGDRTRQGIRIAGRPGQKVLAAESGTVVYSGSGLTGYGNLIIVKHNNDYLSAYGFNRRLMVSEGERVKPGQAVAEVGQASGREYRLHFEIRKKGIAVDPLKYLP